MVAFQSFSQPSCCMQECYKWLHFNLSVNQAAVCKSAINGCISIFQSTKLLYARVLQMVAFQSFSQPSCCMQECYKWLHFNLSVNQTAVCKSATNGCISIFQSTKLLYARVLQMVQSFSQPNCCMQECYKWFNLSVNQTAVCKSAINVSIFQSTKLLYARVL